MELWYGAQCGHEATAATCREIREVEEALWTFVRVEGAEPTNNDAAERALRHGVLWRKGSFGTDKYQSVSDELPMAVEDKAKQYHSEGYVVGIEQQGNVDLSPASALAFGFQLEQEMKQYQGISMGREQDEGSTIVNSTYAPEERTVQPMYFSRNAAFFLQDQHQLGSGYILSGGLRYDLDDEYGHVLNPRVTLLRSPQDGIGFKLLYGEAFKAATIFELYDELRGNENLDPEQVATGELEVHYRSGSKALLKASCFYSKLADIIVVAPNPDPEAATVGPNSEHLDCYQNVGSTSTSGLTVSGYCDFAWTRGEDGEPVDNTADRPRRAATYIGLSQSTSGVIFRPLGPLKETTSSSLASKRSRLSVETYPSSAPSFCGRFPVRCVT